MSSVMIELLIVGDERRLNPAGAAPERLDGAKDRGYRQRVAEGEHASRLSVGAPT